MAVKTDIELAADADIIQAETAAGANTADRIGQMLNDVIENKVNKDEYESVIGYLNQSGVSDPVLTVLKNDTGVTPVLAFGSTGSFSLTMTGVFVTGKTFIAVRRQVTATDKEAIYSRSNADTILIQTFTTSTGTAGNGLLNDTPIEIRIYK